TGSTQPAAPLPRAPSPRACSRSSEPAGTHARFPVVPSAAAPLPPGRCEKSIPALSHPPNMVPSPKHSTTSGNHRKPVLTPVTFSQLILSVTAFRHRRRGLLGGLGGHLVFPRQPDLDSGPATHFPVDQPI